MKVCINTKLKRIIIFLSVIFFSFSSVFAANIFGTESKEVYRIGYTEGFGGIDNIDSPYNKGYLYDLIVRMEYYTDASFEYVEFEELALALEALENGEIDVVGPFLRTEEREEKYIYSSAIGDTMFSLVTTKTNYERNNYHYDEPSEIDGKTVASYYGSPFEEYLDEYCKQNNISVNYVRSDQSTYQKLDADFYLAADMFDGFDNYKTVLNLGSAPIHMLLFDDSKFDEMESVFEKAIKGDGNLLSELSNKYHTNVSIQRRGLTKDELNFIQNTPLKVGYEISYAPFTYMNEKREPTGISVEAFKSIAKEYGINDIEFVPYNLNDNNPSDEEYALENCDLILSVLGDLESFEESFYSSESYFNSPLIYLMEDEEAHIVEDTDAVVAHLNISTMDPTSFESTENYSDHSKHTVFNSLTEIADEYNDGDIDVILLSEYSLPIVSNQLTRDFKTFTSTGSFDLKLWISKDMPKETLNIFNIMYAHMPESEINHIVAVEQLNQFSQYNISNLIRENIGFILFAFVLIILILVIYKFYEKNKRKNLVLSALNKDELTGGNSFIYFKEQASNILLKAKPKEYEIISIDIDNFNSINTIFGVKKGDDILISMSEALIKEYNNEDALVAREAVDHFYILQKVKKNSNTTDNSICCALNERLGGNLNLSTSTGVFIIDNPSLELTKMLKSADIARIKGKKTYNSTIYYYNEEMEKEEDAKLNIIANMKLAIEKKEFYLKYQPKIDFNSLTICGAEALVRWKKEGSDREIYPNEFIPVFESNGFIANLDYYVFEEACSFIKNNSETSEIPLISVNLSNHTLFEADFAKKLIEILNKYDLKSSQLELEITESAMELEERIIKDKIQELRGAGFKVSIDDFGVGASSLNRLASLDVNTLKIDKGFLDSGFGTNRGNAIIKNIIKMANEIDLVTVCEGVETLTQAKWLRSSNCDIAQGYYFEKPVYKEEFLELLLSKKKYMLK